MEQDLDARKIAERLIRLTPIQREGYLKEFCDNNPSQAIGFLGIEIMNMVKETNATISSNDDNFSNLCNSAIKIFQKMIDEGDKNERKEACDKIMEILKMADKRFNTSDKRKLKINYFGTTVTAVSVIAILGIFFKNLKP